MTREQLSDFAHERIKANLEQMGDVVINDGTDGGMALTVFALAHLTTALDLMDMAVGRAGTIAVLNVRLERMRRETLQ